MVAQKGSLVQLKIGNGGSPTETFVNVGGLQITRFNLSYPPMENSNCASGAWRQLQTGSGLRALAVSGNGIFTNSAAEETLRGQAFAGTSRNYRLTFGNGDRLDGAFLITAYERAGAHTGEETFSVTLQSAGEMVFTAG